MLLLLEDNDDSRRAMGKYLSTSCIISNKKLAMTAYAAEFFLWIN